MWKLDEAPLGGSGYGVQSSDQEHTISCSAPSDQQTETLSLGFDMFNSISVMMKTTLLLLVLSAALCAAQRHRITSRTEWNEGKTQYLLEF